MSSSRLSFFFFKQKTAYEMRISDWSSDVGPSDLLAGFSGHLVADAYAGFNALYVAERQPGPVIPVACWAHVRRKFHDVYAAKQSPVAQEALERIAALYAVEKAIRGRPPDERHQVRQECSRPVAEDLFAWIDRKSTRLNSSH